MKKIQFIKDGNLSPFADKLFSLIGVISAISLIVFSDCLDGLWFWLVAAIAIFFGYGSAWARLIQRCGFKPFTNDPLGWRKAKETYKSDAILSSAQKDDLENVKTPDDNRTL